MKKRINARKKTIDAINVAIAETFENGDDLNVFNVHSNRSPVDGKIEKIQYFPGKFVNADLDKASLENERNAIVLTTADAQTVTFVQVAGLIARRIL